MASKPPAGKTKGKQVRAAKPEDAGAPSCCEPGTTPSFNEAAIRAMEDIRAGRDLTRYADEDELFEKMGIKVGKAKT